jgi:DNA modification methylase
MIEAQNNNSVQDQDGNISKPLLSPVRVFNGDCLEIMKSIPDGSIDMILCDLPYGTTKCKWDNIIPFEPLWEQYKRIIKDKGAIVLTASQPFTSALIMSHPQLFKYEWIWEKSKASNFLQASYMPLKAHENVLIFSKSGKTTYNPQKTQGVPYFRGGIKEKHDNPEVSNTIPNYHTHIRKSEDGMRLPRTVQYFKTAEFEGKFHPTQKPVALFEYLIKTYTNEGETVLDNCAGSGTTGIACMNTNRNCILIEKEKNYFDIINERIAKHTQQRAGEFSFENEM